MYISLEWLKDFVDIPKGVKPEDLANELTLKTAEIEGVQDESETLANMCVGFVEELKKHPNADKLKVAKVSTGKDSYQVVCGGRNLKQGMYIAFAKTGSKCKWHGEGDWVEIEKVKLRGVESHGMICQSVEIGLSDPNEGPEDVMDLSAMKPEIGMPLSEIFGKEDTIFEFDNKSLTHRPDLWGHEGIAREVAAITGGKYKPCNPKVKIPTKGESVKVEIKNYDLCPEYCGLIIENIKIGESPEWMKRRLKATGHGVHSNIVDVTNYVMHEIGKPMHAFDKNYIKGGIVVRNAEGGEKIKTLDGKEGKLSTSALVIADHEKPVALAGVMGAENSEINDNTTSIILESANFNAGYIRRASTKFGVRTDAVQHFEKSLAPYLAELAILRAAELILEICPGAKIAGPMTIDRKAEEKPRKIDLNLETVCSEIGVEISEKDIKVILEKLGFKISAKKKGVFEVEVPKYRPAKDISIEDDLVEEVARMYGYENIPATLPDLPTRLPMDNVERHKKHRMRELLSHGMGLDEVYNYSFYSEGDIKKCLMTEDNHIFLENPLSEDQTHMRYSLVPNLMKNLVENVKYFGEFGIYEVGRTYREIGEFFPLEEKRITGVIVRKGKKAQPFYEAKGIIEEVFKRFGVDVEMASGADGLPFADQMKAVSYLHAGDTLGEVFCLDAKVIRNYGLEKYQVAFFCVNFTKLMKVELDDKKYKQIPKFPNMELDISVLIDSDMEVGAVRDAILSVDSHLLKDVQMFDLYEGDDLAEGKKAVAYRLILQADDRTLTDQDMAEVQKKVFDKLEKMGGQIRGK